jgi:RimJ/RimL family protein N-acetyltransferase
MSEYTAVRLWDYEIVCNTMDAVWDAISEDNAPPYTPDIVNESYVAIFADGEYVGMYRLHQHNSVLWEGHAFMLPDKRSHSLGGGNAIQQWVIDNIPDLQKMIVNVPECFPNVMAFVQKIGFTEQGYNSNSYTKGGLVGMYQYGITIEDMKCQQQQ